MPPLELSPSTLFLQRNRFCTPRCVSPMSILSASIALLSVLVDHNSSSFSSQPPSTQPSARKKVSRLSGSQSFSLRQ